MSRRSAHATQLLEQGAEPGQARSRSGLDRAEGDVEVARDLGLGQPAPVGELEDGALAFGQPLERRVDPPGEPRDLGHLVGPGVRACDLGNLRHRDGALPRPVDDRVAGNGEKPRRGGATIGAVAPGRAPDRREGLLGRLLGAPVVPELAPGHAEHGTGEAPVELLERIPVAAARPLDEHRIVFDRGDSRQTHLELLYGTLGGTVQRSRRPPSTTREVPVVKGARVR